MAVYKLANICYSIRGNSSFQKKHLKTNMKENHYVALHYGKTYKVNRLNNDYNFFVSDSFYKENQLVQRYDTILISTSETLEDLGHSYLYDREDLGLLGGEQILLKANEDIVNKEYLYYLTKQFKSNFRKYATGMKVYRFKIDDFNHINVNIPSISEQEKIIEIIKPFEDLIDNIKRQINNVKKLLVDKYMINNQERVKLVDYIANYSERYSNQQEYLATNAVGEFSIDLNKVQDISNERPSRADLSPVSNSIIMSKLDGENKLLFIDNNFKYVVSTGFFNFKTKYLDHVVGFLLSDSFQKQKSILSTGTTMIGLNNDGLANIETLKPIHTEDKLTFLLNQLIKTEIALILEKDKIISLLIK